MIDEKKLIEDLQKWTDDDLYTPKQFQTLIEAQPCIKSLKIIDGINKFVRSYLLLID